MDELATSADLEAGDMTLRRLLCDSFSLRRTWLFAADCGSICSGLGSLFVMMIKSRR